MKQTGGERHEGVSAIGRTMSSDQESGNRGPVGLFDRLSLTERKWTLAALRNETVGGVLMLTAAAVALILANSQFGDWYAELS